MRRDTLSIRGLALAAVAALACVAASAWAQGPAASQPAVLVDRKEGVPGLKALKERKGAGADEAVKSAAEARAEAPRAARAARIARGVSWAGRTLAVWDAYQGEAAAAKKEGRVFSQANLTRDVALNLSGITGAVGAVRATSKATDDMLKQTLKGYEAAGYDINSPRVQAMAAMKAIGYGTVVGIYNGAKCLPVIGDMIAVGELTEAGVGLVYDTRETRQAQRANYEARTETFNSAVAASRRLANQLAGITGKAKSKMAAMDALGRELKDTERQVGALRERYVKDYQAIEKYNQKPPGEPAGAGGADISPAAVRKLGDEVKGVTTAAQENAGSARRVMGEQGRGQLKPEALATQYKFIVDLLAVVEGRYKSAGGAYRGMAAALAGEPPQAGGPVDIESVRQRALDALASIRSLADTSQGVVDQYCKMADDLTALIAPHQELKDSFTKGFDYFTDKGDVKRGSNDYEDLVDLRSRVVSECRLDTNAIAEHAAGAKELRFLSNRLAREGEGEVPAIKKPAGEAPGAGGQGPDAVRKLGPDVTRMEEAVRDAREAVGKLGALAGRIAPARRDIASVLPPRPPRNPLPEDRLDNLTLKELQKLTGLEAGADKDPHPEVFGYTWHRWDAEQAKRTQDPQSIPAPYMNGYCRLVEKGTLRGWIDVNQNGKQDKNEALEVFPYWIWYSFWGSSSDHYWGSRDRQGKSSRAQGRLADWRKDMARTEPLNVPRADFAVLGTSTGRFSNGTATRLRGLAGVGTFTLEAHVALHFQVGRTYRNTEYQLDNEKRWLYFEDESAVDRNVAFWMTGREPNIREILHQATTVIADFEEHSRDRYVYDAQPLLPTLDGFTVTGSQYDKNNEIRSSAYRNFDRKGSFQYGAGKDVHTGTWSERYRVSLSVESVQYNRSWRQTIEALYQRCQSQTLQAGTAFTPPAPGAGKVVGVHSVREFSMGFGGKYGLRYDVHERVVFVKRNVRAEVNGYGYTLQQPRLLTGQLVQAVAAAIDQRPK